MELRALLWLFTGGPHQTLSQVTLLGSVRGCLNTSAEKLYCLQERNARCPMFGDLMLFRAGPLQFAGPGELLCSVAHDPEPHVISLLPDLPPEAQHVALKRLHSHVVQLRLRRIWASSSVLPRMQNSCRKDFSPNYDLRRSRYTSMLFAFVDKKCDVL